MINNKRVLGIIPARGGSKGLPDKNIRLLIGKPLINWSVEAGLKSKYIDELIVTTDSEKIAEIAKFAGAMIPFLRPAELAKDSSPSIDAILHALNWAEANYGVYEYLVLLEPTSPLRDEFDIDNALEKLDSEINAESIVGVCATESAHPAFLCKIDNELLHPYTDSFNVKRRQEIEDYFFFEGSVYISHVNAIKQKKTFYHDKTLPYIVPKWKSFEIDDIIDFVIIEKLLELKLGGSDFLI